MPKLEHQGELPTRVRAALLAGAFMVAPVWLKGRGAELVSVVDQLGISCPLHRLTGLSCPTCGLGASLLHTATLQLGSAWRMHPFGPTLYVLLLASLLAIAVGLSPQRIAYVLRTVPRPIVALLFVGYVVWGFSRTI